MASILKVDTIQDQSGNNIINENADTITIGASGDTITIPSGATLSNSGTLGAGMGKVLQVVTATDGTGRSTTSTSYVTASNTLSLNITPSSTSNKILLIVTAAFYYDSSIQWGKATIFRDGVNLRGSGSGNGFSTLYNGGSDIACQIAINYLDSPSSTSSLNYQVYFRTENSGIIYINPQNILGSITAMEIAG